MADLNCKLLVIGAGPGGYVCAIKAGQLGIDTIIVEAEKPGGTCLNVGCIPSKALIHVADEFFKLRQFSNSGGALGISAASPAINLAESVLWKDSIVSRLNDGVAGLLKKSGVNQVNGTAQFLDGKTVRVSTSAGQQTIGAEHIVIATGSLPVELSSLPFSDTVISSTQALALPEVPNCLAVVGGGYIGLEIGSAFAKLGSQVIIIEATDRILPQYDTDLTAPVMKNLTALGIEVMFNTRAEGMSNGGLEVSTAGGDDRVIAADKVLVTVGREPATSGCALEELSLTMNDRFIQIDDKCQTSMRGVYAIGDVTGEPMLAHRAMAQGEMVAEIIAGKPRSGVVLGIQAVGVGVSELSASFALALEMGACAEDIAATVHAHPTMSEGFAEACMQITGRALHI